ncbi:MAG: hypothetical protein UY63_C0005G0040 [Parcubacteria group bacterium GW2011_GWA2_51_10]|nr:MAG: hypothetical protein UY63_C0005G0040 [Parcubacteria group bacterium GW2011_GWA2_51_10]
MSFLYHRRTKKVVKVLWGIIAILVIISMIIFFAPGVVNLATGY